jgi:hypothetical protein
MLRLLWPKGVITGNNSQSTVISTASDKPEWEERYDSTTESVSEVLDFNFTSDLFQNTCLDTLGVVL